METITLGQKAPFFLLKDKDGIIHSLQEKKSNYVVVYFYPKDNTSGCTLEAVNFTRDLNKFEKKKTSIIGISGGNEKTKTEFCKKNNLKILLLSDPDFEVCRQYGAYGKKSFLGKSYMGIYRKTFLIDKNKRIIKIYEKVSPQVHSQQILIDIETMEKKQ